MAAWLAAANLPAAQMPPAPGKVPEAKPERMAVALDSIKPADAVIVGLYRRFSEQIGQTAQFVREILGS